MIKETKLKEARNHYYKLEEDFISLHKEELKLRRELNKIRKECESLKMEKESWKLRSGNLKHYVPSGGFFIGDRTKLKNLGDCEKKVLKKFSPKIWYISLCNSFFALAEAFLAGIPMYLLLQKVVLRFISHFH